jgi:hypothetical protein
LDSEISLPLSLKTPLRSMATSGGFELLTLGLPFPGSFKFRAFGATKLEVNMKKINNKKIMSVIDDMLNSAFILFLFFILIKNQLLA